MWFTTKKHFLQLALPKLKMWSLFRGVGWQKVKKYHVQIAVTICAPSPHLRSIDAHFPLSVPVLSAYPLSNCPAPFFLARKLATFLTL